MEGGLDLRLRRLMVRGGDSGPAIVPGNPEKSHLLDRITAGEMPPSQPAMRAMTESKMSGTSISGPTSLACLEFSDRGLPVMMIMIRRVM